MKLFGGPIAHKVIEGYIEQNICFTRIEKEVNEQLFGDFTISADCLRTHILHKRPMVPSSFMRKIICRLRLSEVSRQ